ncbi:hypothetical protein PHMEG_00019666 [Phytophthora megakarya]|uniref:Uncharacterized protein n=1 Tax=Phytophthora megakarya TaxID=4795 RepID=A0A225VSW5_9STRA|nr:hypothetical protein PHMEG_00019666 [Phytophthora megakarya]
MMIASNQQVLNGTTKYNSARRRANQIANIMSHNGTFVFTDTVPTSTDVVSPGRPKVRKQQQISEKKKRIGESKQKATKLVQGTITPVPRLEKLKTLLENDYCYKTNQQKSQPLSERDECETNIWYFSPQWFVTKAPKAITKS